MAKPAPQGVLQEPFVNPKTGRPRSLADDEAKVKLDAEVKRMKRDPKVAEAILRELGLLTPTGRLTKKYGGAG